MYQYMEQPLTKGRIYILLKSSIGYLIGERMQNFTSFLQDQKAEFGLLQHSSRPEAYVLTLSQYYVDDVK